MKVGEVFFQLDLVKILECIVDKGLDEFYKGYIVDLLVVQMQQDKGLIIYQDFVDYKVRWCELMCVDWQGNMFYIVLLLSFGGIVLVQLLGIKENCVVDFKGVELNFVCYIYLLVEIEKCVFVDCVDYFGDLDFFKVLVVCLIDLVYLKQCVVEVNLMVILLIEKVCFGLELYQIMYFFIVDVDGNVVSNIYIFNWDFGSGVVVKGVGFLFNDEMDDFSVKLGVVNVFGVVGSDVNVIELGKCMFFSMSLSIVICDGKVSLVVGMFGGLWIFILIFQVLNNIYDFYLLLEKVVVVQCVYYQLLFKDMIYYDVYVLFVGKVVEELKVMGYILEDQGWNMGDIQVICVDGKVLEIVFDFCGCGVGLVVKF